MLWKYSAHFLSDFFLFLPCFIFIRFSLVQNRYYFYHICLRDQLSVFSLNRVQSLIHDLVGEDLFFQLQRLSYTCNVVSLSLSYRFFYSKCSDDLQFFINQIRPLQLGCAKHGVEQPSFSLCSKISTQTGFPQELQIAEQNPEWLLP